jgi:cytochrome c oxidase subunit 1
MSATATIDHPHHAEHAHDDHGHQKSWIWRYVFSTDHKVIGLQYGLSALIFLLFGFFLMMVMRWRPASLQVAHLPAGTGP